MSSTGENLGVEPEQGIEVCDDVVGNNGGQSLNINLDTNGVEDRKCENVVKESHKETAREDHKRKKTRRARKGRYNDRAARKPYSKAWQDKGDQHRNDLAREEASNARAKMFSYGLPEAPYNTTQFLMDDHNDLQDLDVKLQAATANSAPQNVGFSVLQKPPRARDSSFSMDSEDDYFYSSPSDEEEFLTREFANTYEDLHAERLGTLSKSQLIQDYVQLEGKVDLLEKRLKKNKEQSSSNSDADAEVPMESESQKNALQQQVNFLTVENERLTRENERLRLMASTTVPSTSSVDSESDSTDSTCSSSSDSDNNEQATTNESKTLVTT